MKPGTQVMYVGRNDWYGQPAVYVGPHVHRGGHVVIEFLSLTRPCPGGCGCDVPLREVVAPSQLEESGRLL